MTKKTSPAYRASKEETIPINKLHPFSNHPFHIRHDLEFSELVDSISESGIITPIIVRPKVGVGYEVISGHRRWEACKELGIESIPARVEYIDDDEATILMPSHLRCAAGRAIQAWASIWIVRALSNIAIGRRTCFFPQAAQPPIGTQQT